MNKIRHTPSRTNWRFIVPEVSRVPSKNQSNTP